MILKHFEILYNCSIRYTHARQWDRWDLESAGPGGNLLPLTPACPGSCGLWHREHPELFLQTFSLCLYGPRQRLCWRFPSVSPFPWPPGFGGLWRHPELHLLVVMGVKSPMQVWSPLGVMYRVLDAAPSASLGAPCSLQLLVQSGPCHGPAPGFPCALGWAGAPPGMRLIHTHAQACAIPRSDPSCGGEISPCLLHI